MHSTKHTNRELPDRRYSISEVSELTGLPDYALRQWEAKIPQLRPKRDRGNRRYYLLADIEIVRRIKQLHYHEKISLDGVRQRLSQELRGEGRPRTRQDQVDMLDLIESEVRGLLDLLDDV